MPICYLTGHTIEEKDHPITDNHKSLEHIIPNALGGKISSNYILTHAANQNLNNDIDKEFNKIFTSFTTRLDVKRDRENNQTLNARHQQYQVDVTFKSGRYFPKKPFYDKEKNIIYADSVKTGENYKKLLTKKKEIDRADQTKILDDLAGEISIPFNLENKTFKRGLAKIAAGFATLKGVKRENLKDVIDLKNKTIKDRIIVSPYLPTAPAEGFLEENINKSPYYPIHSLVLRGKRSERFLYCYVELFSAFQYYVLLDCEYEGDDICEPYIYSILEEKEIAYSEYINSIPDAEDLEESLPIYRELSLQKFIQLTNVSIEEQRFYCHRKFNALSALSNYLFLMRKAQSLGQLD